MVEPAFTVARQLATLLCSGMILAKTPLNASAAALASPVSFMGDGQRSAWGSVLGALKAGGTISVVMIGGSMARGQGCTMDPTQADGCAYAARLVTRLRSRFPRARLLFENRAVGGMTTGGTLLSLPTLSQPVNPEDGASEPDASVLLVDFAINDNFEAQSLWTMERKREDLKTYLQLKTHLKRFNQGEQVHRSVSAASEAMLRYLLEHRPRTAVLISEGTCWKSPTRRTHEAHRNVARYYGVAHFDFTDSLSRGVATQTAMTALAPGGDMCVACIRPRKGCEHSSFPVLFSDGKHPDGRGHQLVADALGALLDSWWKDETLIRLSREHRRAVGRPTPAATPPLVRLPAPFTDRALLAQHSVCVQPTSFFSAAALATIPPPHANVTIESGGWRLYEDRPGKPGWISDGPNNTAIEFTVRFGLAPRLTFLWTLGYEGFARAAVRFNSDRNRHRVKVIEAVRSDGLKVTQAAVLDMDVGHMHHGSRLDLSYGVAGWAIKPFATERFRVEMLCNEGSSSCGKFKVLAVRAC